MRSSSSRKLIDAAPEILINHYRRYMELYQKEKSSEHFERASVVYEIAMDVLIGDSWFEFRDGTKQVAKELGINSG